MKSVIVTGANRGIGLEISLAFARAGYKVFATMRNPDSASVLKQKIKDESLSINISAMDVNSDESVKQCMESILKENGPLDVLVNNAGVERHGSVEELTMEDFKDVMETNFLECLDVQRLYCPLCVLTGMDVLLIWQVFPAKLLRLH